MFSYSEDAGKESPSALKSSPWMKIPQMKRFLASHVFHIEVTYIIIYVCVCVCVCVYIYIYIYIYISI